MKNIFKKLLVLAIMFIPVMVNAEEVTEVSTLADLTTCFSVNGSTCKLNSDIIFTNLTDLRVYKTIILDLNNHEINGPITNGLLVYSGDLTIKDSSEEKNGKIINTRVTENQITGKGLGLRSGAKLTIENGYFYGSSTGLYMFYDDSSTVYKNQATINGGTIEGGTYGIYVSENDVLTVNNGEVKAAGFALCNNGQDINTTMIINGGEFTSTNSSIAIYHPGDGNLELNGGTITGGTGIEIRAGRLTVNKGKVTGTYKPTEVTANGNGPTTAGAGIAIAQHTTKKNITVTINGGEISGFHALYESNPQGNSSDDIAKISITVNAGKLTAINGSEMPVYSEDFTEFIFGGEFTQTVDSKYIKVADYTDLNNEIVKVGKLVSDNYTNFNTVSDLLTTIAEKRKGTLMQSEVNALLDSLIKAEEALQLKTADYSALNKIIEEANVYIK